MFPSLPTRLPRRLAAAFTLLELLATVGLIIVLVALLFPMMGGLRKDAQGAKSSGNLRQIFTAAQTWSSDNDGVIVPCYNPGDGDANSSRNFTAMLAPYLSGDPNIFSPTMASPPPDVSPAIKLPVFVFPLHPKRFGYGYNYAYLSIVNTGQGWSRLIRAAAVPHPAETVFLVTRKSNASDDEAFTSWRAYVRPPSVYKSISDHVPAFELPGKRAQVLWLDGHVSAETEERLMADDSLWDLN